MVLSYTASCKTIVPANLALGVLKTPLKFSNGLENYPNIAVNEIYQRGL